MRVLSIVANPKPVEQSASLKIERAFIEALRKKRSDAQFERVDVYRDEIPLLDEKFLPVFSGASAGDAEGARLLKRQQSLLEQFMVADLIVIASPMWNFSVTPMLKAYIDNILVAGKTFRYTEKGPVGTLSGKRAVLCLASGGIYEGALAAYDHLGPYLRTVLGFMGITDIAEIRASGQGIDPETAKKSTDAAIRRAIELAAQY